MGTVEWSLVEAQWNALRPKVARYWSRLPEEELELLPGDRASLVQLVKRHYALDQRGAEAQVDAWLAGLSSGPPSDEAAPPPAATKEEQRAEGEGMGVVPGAANHR
jgi:hypothetical protein